MSIINNINFDSLIRNLGAFVLGENIEGDLEFLKRSDFTQVVEKTGELFFSCLETSKLSEKINEHVPGRIFVRLERIAILRYGLSLDQAHKIMEKFIQKTLGVLYTSLPSGTILSQYEKNEGNENFKSFKIEIRNNSDLHLPSQLVLIHPIEKTGCNPPFYYEKQGALMSCQLHAFNVAAQGRCVDLNHVSPADAERNGININLLNRMSNTHVVVRVPIDDLLSLDRFKECKSFMVSNGGHVFVYHKDSNGQWWRIDSLYNVGNWNYQVPVDLKDERSFWASDTSVNI